MELRARTNRDIFRCRCISYCEKRREVDHYFERKKPNHIRMKRCLIRDNMSECVTGEHGREKENKRVLLWTEEKVWV